MDQHFTGIAAGGHDAGHALARADDASGTASE
jgi:hypothetical protein